MHIEGLVLLLTFLAPGFVLASETSEEFEAFAVKESQTEAETTATAPLPDSSSNSADSFSDTPNASGAPLTTGEKSRLYLNSVAGPASIFGSMVSSGYNQAVDSVPEWGQGMAGYGKRFASSLGQKAVSHTVHFGLKAMLHEDPRYHYSRRTGFWPRVLHAVGETFVAHKDTGGTRPNYSYFTGVATGVYVSRQWRPERERTAKEYVQSGVVSIGGYAAKNVFREFWPDIRKKLLKR